jgi:asparagine synthase (glutamine-hydrolysing)
MSETSETVQRGDASPSAGLDGAGAAPGILLIASATGVELRLQGTLAERPGSLIDVYEKADLLVALMGRLYYRSDLLARIGSASTADPGDAALAAGAYAAGGAAELERLEGEFAVILFDRRNRTAVALRDPMGGYPVFWAERDGALMLSTSLRLLAPLAPDLRLDLGYFGELMTLPFAEIDYHGGTPFEQVQRLPSGSMLIAPHKGPVQVRSYWDWQERLVDPGPQSAQEIGAQYGALLREATHQRLCGRVAAHLSGGMDSTSTALIAARAHAAKGEAMHALCLVYEKLTDLALETPYLESALSEPGLVPHRVAADEILDFDLFRNAPLHDEPYSGLYRAGTDIAMLDVAVAQGCHTVLTGIGADEVLDTAPFYMADMLRRGRLPAAWGQAAMWARAFNSNPWRIFRPFALAPLAPAWLQPGLGPLLRKGHADWANQSQLTIAPWVLPEFASRAGIQARIHARVRYACRSADTVVLSDALGRLRSTCGDWVRYNLGAPRNVHIAHPLRDPPCSGLRARRADADAPDPQAAEGGAGRGDEGRASGKDHATLRQGAFQRGLFRRPATQSRGPGGHGARFGRR